MTICPACLREEFVQAPRAGEGKAQNAIKQENNLSLRRASARAERLSGGLQSGSSLTPHGSLRLVLGLIIFLICTLIFMLGSSLDEWQIRSILPEEAQRPVSCLLCWVAAALVFSASRQNKGLLYPLAIFFVIAGWFMPPFWTAVMAREAQGTAMAIATSRADNAREGDEQAVKSTSNVRALTEEDLSIYREKRQAEGGVVNYAIYLDVRDIEQRQKVRDALVRLLEAEICVPYTRGKGSLFVVARAVGGTRNISPMMARFGELTYASPSEGIYEVTFSAEKAHTITQFPTEVLSTPSDPAFVEGNLAQLRNLMEPKVVSLAAGMLASANVQEQRDEIRNVLSEVLRDPWSSEPGTYQALVEALAIYAPVGDREAVDQCRKYFLNSRIAHRPPAPSVVELLIREVPQEMVAPVVELWRSNPVEWESVLVQLGTLSQDYLLEMLEDTENTQFMVSILKHLEQHGTPEAIPVVQPFVDHPAARVSQAARSTLRVLQAQAF